MQIAGALDLPTWAPLGLGTRKPLKNLKKKLIRPLKISLLRSGPLKILMDP